MTAREIQDLWELFECAQCHCGDPAAQLLLRISMQSALLDGIRQSATSPPENGEPPALEADTLDITPNMERWWGSICVSRRYGDPPLAFYCFEKALETSHQQGLRLVTRQETNTPGNTPR